MSNQMNAEKFIERLEAYRSPDVLHHYQRSFHAVEGDQFFGVRMGKIFELAKEFREMPLNEVEKLLDSPFHEVRVGGVSILDFQARSKKTSANRREQLYDLYIRR